MRFQAGQRFEAALQAWRDRMADRPSAKV